MSTSSLRGVIIRSFVGCCLIGTAALPFSSPAGAGPASDDPCESAQTQTALTQCWANVAAKADAGVADRLARLNRSTASAGTVQKDLLKKEQAAWTAYASAHCAIFRARAQGGSAESMTASICRYRLATQRSADLDALIEEWSR